MNTEVSQSLKIVGYLILSALAVFLMMTYVGVTLIEWSMKRYNQETKEWERKTLTEVLDGQWQWLKETKIK